MFYNYKPFFSLTSFSKNEEPKKQCRSKKSATKQNMGEKCRKNSQRMIPHTERNASGRNWEMFKNLVSESSLLNSDSSSKEKVKKKHRHAPVSNVSRVLPVNEEVIDDENKKKLTKHVAMDCEMVGIGDGTESMVARVSIVNHHGFCVYDKYVKPREPVQDYRTKVSGIRPDDLQNGEEFEIVQKEVAEILTNRILVGHALKHDLDVLYLSHPRKYLRDTSRYKIFRRLCLGNTPSLKKLTCELLGREIQTGEHNSIEDAKAAMQLYMLYRNKWESDFYFKCHSRSK